MQLIEYMYFEVELRTRNVVWMTIRVNEINCVLFFYLVATEKRRLVYAKKVLRA